MGDHDRGRNRVGRAGRKDRNKGHESIRAPLLIIHVGPEAVVHTVRIKHGRVFKLKSARLAIAPTFEPLTIIATYEGIGYARSA